MTSKVGAAYDRSSAAVELVGRVLLAFLFIHEDWSKAAHFGAAAAYMDAYGRLRSPSNSGPGF
jgi:uncharacterized membrane protein YphA (DoxX/SURF4 family)